MDKPSARWLQQPAAGIRTLSGLRSMKPELSVPTASPMVSADLARVLKNSCLASLLVASGFHRWAACVSSGMYSCDNVTCGGQRGAPVNGDRVGGGQQWLTAAAPLATRSSGVRGEHSDTEAAPPAAAAQSA